MTRRASVLEPVEFDVYDGLAFKGTVRRQKNGSWVASDHDGNELGVFPDGRQAGQAVLVAQLEKVEWAS